MYDCGEITYIGRSDEQLKRALSLVSVNEYDEIKVNGYIIDGESVHFLTQNKGTDELKKVKDCNLLPTLMCPTKLFDMISNFVKETDTMEGNYNGDGSLQKGFKIFHTERDDLKYSWMYRFSVKPVLVYYGK